MTWFPKFQFLTLFQSYGPLPGFFPGQHLKYVIKSLVALFYGPQAFTTTYDIHTHTCVFMTHNDLHNM